MGSLTPHKITSLFLIKMSSPSFRLPPPLSIFTTISNDNKGIHSMHAGQVPLLSNFRLLLLLLLCFQIDEIKIVITQSFLKLGP